jgi:urease accessory protein
VQWGIPFNAAATGLAWSWLENQIAAATKLVPLGQTQAQQLLSDLQRLIPATIATAMQVEEDDIGGSLPALAIASARHETQYTRLFRS